MHRWGTRSLACGSLVIALAAAYFAVPHVAHAAPTESDIEQKKTEHTAQKSQLAAKRIELAKMVDAYIGMARDIERLESEVSQVSSDVASADVKLQRRREALADRVVQLYRNDRASILTILLTSKDFDDFLNRSYFITLIGERDAQLVQQVADARVDSMYLQERLSMRLDRLKGLIVDIDVKRKKIEDEVADEEKRSIELGEDLARMLREQAAAQAAAASTSGSKPGTDFNPDTIISQSAFRAADSMTIEQIQAFLDKQPGVLATYRTRDHNGEMHSVAEMIAEAAKAWRISPKVLLVKLQKEQSLLSKSGPSQRALDWALGVGKTDSRTLSKYKGFGNQVWYGAKSLDTNTRPWHEGISRAIDGSVVNPTNSATYSLYRYTPHLHGNMSFWLLYWRYFGDPLAEAGATATP
ncbi:MAG TPA: hypothetical protein VFG89_00405 [Coriobacteriia bacterium]|nr:hypothetical protein [Coriobacteriia bacterium]